MSSHRRFCHQLFCVRRHSCQFVATVASFGANFASFVATCPRHPDANIKTDVRWMCGECYVDVRWMLNHNVDVRWMDVRWF